VKEIGEKLKETREDMGISLDEAAEDLKLRPSQIENIEAGNIEAFKDIFYLKYFIRDYAKYLGLDHEAMIDEFNEYLFDYTSKISIDEIKKAKKKSDKKEEKKKIASPYTLDKKTTFAIPPLAIYALIAILGIIIIYFFVSLDSKDDFKEESIIGYNLDRGVL
jgi:cytoskeletal protein RodZ